jgi:hypothetical protein
MVPFPLTFLSNALVPVDTLIGSTVIAAVVIPITVRAYVRIA